MRRFYVSFICGVLFLLFGCVEIFIGWDLCDWKKMVVIFVLGGSSLGSFRFWLVVSRCSVFYYGCLVYFFSDLDFF